MVEEVLRGPHGIKLPTTIPSAYDMAGFGSYVGGGREVPRGAAEPHLWDTGRSDWRKMLQTAAATQVQSMRGSGHEQSHVRAVIASRHSATAEDAVEAERLFAELLAQRVAEMGDQTTGEMELAQAAQAVLQRFNGVVAANEVPPHGDGAWVVNEQRRGHGGTHWMGVVRLGGVTYFWDSFGRTAQAVFPHEAWAQGAVSAEADVEQQRDESLCGQATIAWLGVVEQLGISAALHV